MKGKYNMNTKGKIDFTKTDNIQFIEEVASEISKEDKNWQWEAREIKQHSLLLWWEYLEDEKQEGFRIEYDEAEEVFSSEIRFVKGRLKFGNSKQAAPFPSMVVIFRGAGM